MFLLVKSLERKTVQEVARTVGLIMKQLETIEMKTLGLNLFQIPPRKTEEPVFRGVPAQTMPPDQMKMMIEMMSSLCDKVENMEKRLNNLIN